MNKKEDTEEVMCEECKHFVVFDEDYESGRCHVHHKSTGCWETCDRAEQRFVVKRKE